MCYSDGLIPSAKESHWFGGEGGVFNNMRVLELCLETGTVIVPASLPVE